MEKSAMEDLAPSDKLAIALACLAGVMAIILFLIEKTPGWVVFLLLSMVALVVYPVLHFAKGIRARLSLLSLVAVATLAFGWSIWPRHVEINSENVARATPTVAVPSAEEIAEQVAKKVPRQHDVEKQLRPEDLKTRDRVSVRRTTEVERVQASATSLINRLADTVAESFDRMNFWQRQPPSQGTQYELSVVRSEFDAKYNKDYKDEVVAIHKELMGRIKALPQPVRGLSRERIYRPYDEIPGEQITPYDAEDQLIDTCILLLQMEQENSLSQTCSVSELHNKLHSHQRL
jgi:hypothetical protein